MVASKIWPISKCANTIIAVRFTAYSRSLKLRKTFLLHYLEVLKFYLLDYYVQLTARLLVYRSNLLYRVIHKSPRDFRTRLRNNQDRHGRKEHINKQRISPSIFVLGALAYFQVPPLGGSRDEKWRSQ